MHKIKLDNERILEVISRKEIDNYFEASTAKCCVCLISFWKEDDLNKNTITSVVEKLIAKGCEGFVCVGALSEVAHDFIDSILESKGEHSILTTWHAGKSGEPKEDIVDMFINAFYGDLPDTSKAVWLAILNTESEEDNQWRAILLREGTE